MFQEFYKWLTYNPHGIDFDEIVPSISFIVFIIAISCTALLWDLRGKLSLKTIVEGVLMAGYIFFTMLWSLCFYDRKLAVKLFPIYPPIILLLLKPTYLLFKKIVIYIVVRIRQRLRNRKWRQHNGNDI